MSFILNFLLLSGLFLCAPAEQINIIKAPYHVQVESHNKFLCSGAIVDYKWVVTTASCLPESYKKKDIQIRSGASAMTKNGGVHPIREIHVHPLYDPSKSKTAHNLVLVQLWYHFMLSCTVFPMHMPTITAQAGQSAFYSTFLMDTTRGAHLNVVRTVVSDWNQCRKEHSMLATDTVCLERPAANVCVDEGDPVITEGNVQGIVQNGGCPNQLLPIVLTDLSAYVGWINDKIKNSTKHAKGEKPPRKDPCTWRQILSVQN